MPTIAASFPEAERKNAVSRGLLPGVVLYLSCPFTSPPKDKFIIVGDPDDPPLLVVINSAIHPYVQARPHLLQCQVLISAKAHTFLSHDSYADCAHVEASMSLEEVRVQLEADPSRIRGAVATKSVADVLAALSKASTVSPSHLVRITASLKV